MEEKEEENLAAPERAVHPVNNRPSGTTGQPPPNNRPLFCDQAVQGRYSTGSTCFCPMTGTTAPTSGTTAGAFDRYIRSTTAQAVQPANHRPTTGRYSVIKRCKAGTALVLPVSAQ